jgi:hypothetical protein
MAIASSADRQPGRERASFQLSRPLNVSSKSILVGDIGGTHARFAILERPISALSFAIDRIYQMAFRHLRKR